MIEEGCHNIYHDSSDPGILSSLNQLRVICATAGWWGGGSRLADLSELVTKGRNSGINALQPDACFYIPARLTV